MQTRFSNRRTYVQYSALYDSGIQGGMTVKKHLVSLACLFLALVLACPASFAEAGGSAAYTIEKKTFPYLYCFLDGTEPATSEMNLYFVNGGDVPYVALTEFIPVLAEMFNTCLKCDEGNQISFDIQIADQASDSSVFIVTRPDNGSTWIIQPGDDTMTFTNYNSFCHKPGTSSLVSVTELPDLKQTFDYAELVLKLMYANKNDSDLTELQMLAAGGLVAAEDPAAEHTLFVSSNKLYNRNGMLLTMDLGKYQIDIVSRGDECYLPLQTMSDVFCGLQYIYYVFNGEKVVADVYKGTLMDQAYEAEPADMSQEFALFNFHELCFTLDYFYGLKKEHRIDSFSNFLTLDAGMFAQLSGTDSIAFDAALTEILLRFFDDGHSAIVRNSWRSGQKKKGLEYISMLANAGYSTLSRSQIGMKLGDIRRAVYPDGVPGYEEIGDTAFITFDAFTANRKPKEYYELEDPDNPQDTIELMIYANRMVRREGSPVRNIVIDLSVNGGGNSDAAIAVACWFTGEARFSLIDTMTGAETITCYRTDLNLNGVALSNPEGGSEGFDPGDTVSGQYNLYCLISPQSFSCANLVPAIFDQAGGITLIGQRTGGGSNVVLPVTTASGTIFQISGPLQITTFSNGSLYGVDTGVEPHVRLNKAESFYDREALVEMIHNLK